MFRKVISMVALVLFALGGSSVVCPSTASTQADLVALDSSRAPEIEKRIKKAGVYTSPDRLYAAVWALVKEDFYDNSYKGQDWKRWEKKYEGKLTDMDAAHKAIETMLASLGDRYTRFLDQDAFDDEKNQIEAQLCGIGVQIGLDKQHRVVVIAPIEDTPAQKAGLRPADLILEIDVKATT